MLPCPSPLACCPLPTCLLKVLQRRKDDTRLFICSLFEAFRFLTMIKISKTKLLGWFGGHVPLCPLLPGSAYAECIAANSWNMGLRFSIIWIKIQSLTKHGVCLHLNRWFCIWWGEAEITENLLSRDTFEIFLIGNYQIYCTELFHIAIAFFPFSTWSFSHMGSIAESRSNRGTYTRAQPEHETITASQNISDWNSYEN